MIPKQLRLDTLKELQKNYMVDEEIINWSLQCVHFVPTTVKLRILLPGSTGNMNAQIICNSRSLLQILPYSCTCISEIFVVLLAQLINMIDSHKRNIHQQPLRQWVNCDLAKKKYMIVPIHVKKHW